jgi:sigma-B regulation protein RsbU (phosphoserine phosphatase)
LHRAGKTRFLGGEGTVLGFPDLELLHLSEEQVQLRPGDRLVLYSDGLADTVGSNGQPFGLDRLVTLLESHLDLPPGELCTATFAHLSAYQSTAEQFDDMSMLVLDVA